eukprot:364560-Chlamydomonas_euryale.AAC.12
MAVLQACLHVMRSVFTCDAKPNLRRTARVARRASRGARRAARVARDAKRSRQCAPFLDPASQPGSRHRLDNGTWPKKLTHLRTHPRVRSVAASPDEVKPAAGRPALRPHARQHKDGAGTSVQTAAGVDWPQQVAEL